MIPLDMVFAYVSMLVNRYVQQGGEELHPNVYLDVFKTLKIEAKHMGISDEAEIRSTWGSIMTFSNNMMVMIDRGHRP